MPVRALDRLSVRIPLLTAALVLGAVMLVALASFETKRRALVDSIGHELLGVARTGALFLSAEDHEAVFRGPDGEIEGWDAFERLHTQLESIRRRNHIPRPIYTMRRGWQYASTGKLEFVAMTDRDKYDEPYVGSLIAETPLVRRVYETKEAIATPIYEDIHGRWISALAPVLDEDGNVVAVLSVDRGVEWYYAAVREIGLTLLGISVVAMLTTVLVLGAVMRPIVQANGAVIRAMRNVADGELDARIPEPRGGEMAILVQAFNRMVDSIHRSRRALAHQAHFVNANPTPVVDVGSDGEVVYTNPAADAVFPDLARSGDHPLLAVIAQLRLALDAEGVEHVRVDAELGEHTYALTAAPSSDDGIFVFAIDVTERRSMQRELETALEQAESASVAKSRFLANMSHEIRTPMNGILGLTELTLEGELEPIQRENLELVQQAGRGLLSVLNDVLDFSKIEAGQLELERIPFDLIEVVESALSLAAHGAAERPIEVWCRCDPDVPSRVEGDATRIRQVISNLAGNAFKFTEAGAVGIDVRVVENGRDDVVMEIAVIDTGIGIDPARQASIFDAFSQEDASTSRRFGGTGLGTTISRQLVALMEGTLQLESPNRAAEHLQTAGGPGSTFTVELRLPRHGSGLVGDALGQGLGTVAIVGPAWTRGLEPLLRAWGTRPRWCPVEELPELRPTAILTTRDDLGPVDAPVVSLVSRTSSGSVSMVSTNALRTAMAEALDLGRTGSDVPDVSRADRPYAGVRVLVAEDNAVNRHLIQGLLEHLGCAVTLTRDGREVLDAHAGGEFDIILLDVQMPVRDGLSAVREIRSREEGSARVPILALTAHHTTGDRERCLAAGMDDYLTKPISLTALVAGLERLLGPRRQDRDVA